jgi:predicted permease
MLAAKLSGDRGQVCFRLSEGHTWLQAAGAARFPGSNRRPSRCPRLRLRALLSILTGLLFGTAPVRQLWKSDPCLRPTALGVGPPSGRRASREILLGVQVAACALLVTCSFVAARGLTRSLSMPLGFQPDGVAVASYDLGLAGYSRQTGQNFEKQSWEAAARLPGIDAVAYSNSVPLSIDLSRTTLYREHTSDFRPKNGINCPNYQVSPGYFRAIGTRLLTGREFTPEDGANAPRVAVVNETLARQLTGTPHAVGRRFRIGPKDPALEIVGVVEDGKYEALTEDRKPTVFWPILQEHSRTIVLIARSRRPEPDVAAELRQAINGLDPGMPVYGVGSLRQMLGMAYLPAHAAVIALGSFGALAVMLALTGIYGLAAYAVSRRIREIGIRIAIGARPSAVLRLTLGRTTVSVIAGCAVGMLAGYAGAEMLGSVVHQASPRDPILLGGAALTMAAIGVIAAFGLARRALGIDPVQALRQD